MRLTSRGVALAAILLWPATAGAQTVAHDFPELAQRVKTGERVHVFDLTGREVVGPLAELTDEAIVVGSKRRSIRVERSNVVLVRKDRQDSIVNGILIGAGIGGGLGLLASANCTGFDVDQCAGPIVTGSVIWGVGIGILSDVLHRTPRDIYRVGAPGATFSAEPIAGARAGGLRLAISW